MFRIGLICACMAGLSACVATPSAPNSFISNSRSLPQAQVELRQQADELDEYFHDTGMVSEQHGAAVSRLAGMLMNGRNNNDRPRRLDVYYAAADLESADAETIMETARADLNQATQRVLVLVVAGQSVLNETGLTPGSLSADIAALERVIGEVSQALSLFELVSEDTGASGGLDSEIGSLELSRERLSDIADALANRRRALRASATG